MFAVNAWNMFFFAVDSEKLQCWQALGLLAFIFDRESIWYRKKMNTTTKIQCTS